MKSYYAALVLASLTPTDGRIIGANVVSMHGARSPDKEFKTYCPNNVQEWEVVDRGLTGIGMQQMHDLGTIMMESYVPNENSANNLTIHHKFIDEVLDPTQLVLHAAGAMHSQQSAVAMGHGFFPAKHSPSGYSFNAPLPYDSTAHDDNTLECKNNACKTKVSSLMSAWEKATGEALVEKEKALIEKVGTACGSDFFKAKDGASVFEVIKIVHESFQMHKEQGFPTPTKLDNADLVAFDNFATSLDIDSQNSTSLVTAFAGDLPHKLLNNYRNELARDESPPNEGQHLWSYHAPPATVQAVASMFGMEFKHEEHGVPATTLFIEFHDLNDKPSWKTTTVRTFTWQRCSIKDKDANAVCPRTQIALTKCKGVTADMECPLPEFEEIYNTHIAKNGNWSALCA